tara:strand:- start:122953 stop:123696 length:744 start_codon:yes stop_codon:yes gene_type:complete
MDFSHLHVSFFTDAVENKRKSAEEGRPIYDQIDMVKIQVAGDPKSVLVNPAHSQSSVRDAVTNQRLTYAQLHKAPFEAFKAGTVFEGSGTPLCELSFLNAAKVKELQALNVYSAEALAALDGANLQRLGIGARELKDKAQAWLECAAGSADVTRLVGENAELKDQMAALQKQLDAIANGMDVSPENSIADDLASDTPSPFDDWKDEDIINWIVANGGNKPHHFSSHATIVSRADALNSALAKHDRAA